MFALPFLVFASRSKAQARRPQFIVLFSDLVGVFKCFNVDIELKINNPIWKGSGVVYLFVINNVKNVPFCRNEISQKSIMVQLYDFLQLWNIKEPKCISFKALEQEVVVKAFKILLLLGSVLFNFLSQVLCVTFCLFF